VGRWAAAGAAGPTGEERDRQTSQFTV
jgi:hypothetical protein